MSFISGQLELTLGDTESLSVSTFEGEISLSASGGLPDDYAMIMANSVTSLVINGGSGDNFIDLQEVALDTFPNLADVSISGGDGDDQIFGSEFSDAVYGGAGDDWIYTAQGDDSIWGEAGADSLLGGAGFDTLAAGDGDDLLNGQSGVDCVSGETGDDTIIGGGQADSLYGGDGEDWFADFPGPSMPETEDWLWDSLPPADATDDASIPANNSFMDVSLPTDSSNQTTPIDSTFDQTSISTAPAETNTALVSTESTPSDNTPAEQPLTQTTTVAVPPGITSYAQVMDYGLASPQLMAPGIVSNQLTPINNTAYESDGTTYVGVSLARAPGNTSTVTVNYATSDGTALASDYQSKSGTLIFVGSEVLKSVAIPLVNDSIFETAESFNLNLSTAQNAFISKSSAQVTITDDDNANTLTIANSVINETQGNATVTVSLNRLPGNTSPVTVNYTTSNNSAIQGADYQTTTGSLSFTSTDTTKTISIPIVNDTTNEPQETFRVTLSAPTQAVLQSAVATITINDDDPIPTNKLSVNDVTVNEASGTANVTITLQRVAGNTANVTTGFSTADISAIQASDYTSSSGTATFTGTEQTKTIVISIINDSTFEPQELFALNLSSPTNAILSDGSAVITINDNDLPSVNTLSISKTTVSEADATATLSVSLSRASGNTDAVTVTYGTTNISALVGSDYTSINGTFTFTGSDTTKTVTVPILNDTTPEVPETFKVRLTSATNATLFNSEGIITINDNDAGGNTLSFAKSSVTVNEADLNVYVQVTLARGINNTGDVQVTYDMTDNTTNGLLDYGKSSGTLTFGKYDTSLPITIEILNDIIGEPLEDFNVNLANPTNATLAMVSNQVQIVDNDKIGKNKVSISDVTVNENAGTATVNVTLVRGEGNIQNVQVTVNAIDGIAPSPALERATQPSDYSQSSDTLYFTGTVLTRAFTVPIVNDNAPEATETLFADLTNLVNADFEVRSDGTTPDSKGFIRTTDDDAAIYVGNVLPDEDAPDAPVSIAQSSQATWYPLSIAPSVLRAVPGIPNSRDRIFVATGSYLPLKTRDTSTNTAYTWNGGYNERLDQDGTSIASAIISGTTVNGSVSWGTSTTPLPIITHPVTATPALTVPGYQGQTIIIDADEFTFVQGDTFRFVSNLITVTNITVTTADSNGVGGGNLKGVISSAANTPVGRMPVIVHMVRNGITTDITVENIFTIYQGVTRSLADLIDRPSLTDAYPFPGSIHGGRRTAAQDARMQAVIDVGQGDRLQARTPWHNWVNADASITDPPSPITQLQIELLIDAAVDIRSDNITMAAGQPEIPRPMLKAFLRELTRRESTFQPLALAPVGENSNGLLQFKDERAVGTNFTASRCVAIAIFENGGTQTDWKMRISNVDTRRRLRDFVVLIGQDWRANPYSSLVNGIRSSQQFYDGMTKGIDGYRANDDYRVDLTPMSTPARANGDGNQRDVFIALGVAHHAYGDIIGVMGGVYGGREQSTTPNRLYTTGSTSDGRRYMTPAGEARAALMQAYYDANAPVNGYRD